MTFESKVKQKLFGNIPYVPLLASKELYRNGGKDLFTFSAVNLGWMAKSKSGETLSIEQLASNNPADLVGYTK